MEPAADVVAALILIAGVVVPVATLIGAVALTLVTVPALNPPTSTIDSVPETLFFKNSFPSVVLTANSPSASCAVVGTLAATDDCFTLMVFAIRAPQTRLNRRGVR